MLPDPYLHAKLVSCRNKTDIPDDSTAIVVVSSGEQAEKLAIAETLQGKIAEAIKNRTPLLIVLYGRRKTILAVQVLDDADEWRTFGANIYRKLCKEKSEAAYFRGLKSMGESYRYALLEGLLLGSYDFDKYRKNKDQGDKISIYLSETVFPADKSAELSTLVEAASLTKTLVNEPVIYMDALRFSEVATEAGKQFGFETEILHKDKIEELKMGGLLAVNKGSEIPPTFNIFHYCPANLVNAKPLVLVGKGVMFDTGGYSLKTGGTMSGMKCDMAGGAAVLGIVSAIAGNRLPYHVIGLVPATDNKISSGALVVDDVITMMDGTTVEVQNTDAEGRLVLADALAYAKKFDPELVIDMATLTGASAAITSSFGIAVLGNAQQEIDELKTVGEAVYERLVQLPLWKEYRELLKSDIADLKNIGGPVGGVSTSSLFLKHFTDYPWLHLDIAGAAFVKEAKGYRQSGATAVPVRLVYEFVKRRYKHD